MCTRCFFFSLACVYWIPWKSGFVLLFTGRSTPGAAWFWKWNGLWLRQGLQVQVLLSCSQTLRSTNVHTKSSLDKFHNSCPFTLPLISIILGWYTVYCVQVWFINKLTCPESLPQPCGCRTTALPRSPNILFVSCRDVAHISTCDDGCLALADLLGWKVSFDYYSELCSHSF